MTEITGENQFPFSRADETFGRPENQYSLLGKDVADVEYKSKPLPIRGEPIQSDLSVHRRGPPHLSPERELELIIAVQAGNDAAAGAELSRHFVSWLRKLARAQWRRLASFHRMEFNYADNQSYKDLFAIAFEAFWRAVRAWNPGSGWRLSTFATKWIEGALSDATHDFRNLTAIKNEFHFARFVRSNPGANSWQLYKLFPSMTLNEIERERAFVWDSCLPIEYVEEWDDDDSGDDRTQTATTKAPARSCSGASFAATKAVRWENGLERKHATVCIRLAR